MIHPLYCTILSITLIVCASRAYSADGRYLDELVLRDVGDGREFALVEQYRYVDPRNTLWTVPKGTVVNGASIPQYLWALVGGPWAGKYRNASVIHDYFFDRNQYDSDSVHRVFYDAMLTSGVNRSKAKIMYFAVLRFNPAWKAVEVTVEPCPRTPRGFGNYACYPVLADEVDTKVVYRIVTPEFDADELKKTVSLIERENPSLVEIERLAKAKRDL